ncbi:hypothetical protein [Bosea sp. (in: a-proteobacteria)]|uniref:hypothetical protein n=1 Tax=Bosea sp. (in: a-proteobacteria) TaxID=1871050 RepID=UPI003563D87F
MLRKLTLVAVAGATLLAVTSAGAQIAGNVPDGGPPPPGYGRQAPPPGYQAPPPQPRRYQPPVQSQPYDYRGRDYRGRGDGWDRRPRYGYDEPAPYRPRGRFGDYCATSRGACQTRPQPVGSSCRCDIDGLIKRGIIQ